MKRIVVDTNVAFSTFLNINSRIGQILLNGSKHYNFFAPEYIKYELIEHKGRIKEIGNLSDDKYIELYGMILQQIHTINHSIVPAKFYKSAIKKCKEIDMNDVAFVAINDYLRGHLWTGDTKLIKGLFTKGYTRIITTNELYIDFLQKENQK